MNDHGLTQDERQFVGDIKKIVATARRKVYQTADLFQVVSNWLLGRRIVEQEQRGKSRAKYGAHVIELASEALTEEFGRGYSETSIKNFRKFYLEFRGLQIPQPLLAEFGLRESEIRQIPSAELELSSSRKGQKLSAELADDSNAIQRMPSAEFGALLYPNLSWSHYERLMRVQNVEAREWYLHEAAREQWSWKTLDRNISSQYYQRLLQTPDSKKGEVVAEMKRLTADYERDKFQFMKNPVVAEFMGLSNNPAFTESNLESAIITHLQKFILELGKGYAFVARQQHIKTDMGDYYIDLVFYNYILKCFFLIDLKSCQISHADVGQMDMYVRMYDELKAQPDDNPTIGILLCAETSRDLARYSILKGNRQIFAAKYLTYLPKEEELIAEIEKQKEIFALQMGLKKDEDE